MTEHSPVNSKQIKQKYVMLVNKELLRYDLSTSTAYPIRITSYQDTNSSTSENPKFQAIQSNSSHRSGTKCHPTISMDCLDLPCEIMLRIENQSSTISMHASLIEHSRSSEIPDIVLPSKSKIKRRDASEDLSDIYTIR